MRKDTKLRTVHVSPRAGIAAAAVGFVIAAAVVATESVGGEETVNLPTLESENLIGQAGCHLDVLPLIPLTEFATHERYKGFAGGLYPSGNRMSPGLMRRGLELARQIEARGADGGVDQANGRIVLLSIGMSNTRAEFEAFAEIAAGDARTDPRLTIVNGAQGGNDVADWGDNPRAGKDPWRRLSQVLSRSGVTPLQVQVVWIKQAKARPSEVGVFPESTRWLQQNLKTVVERIPRTFPNVKLIYVSSRTSAFTTVSKALNPEPYAYENGFAVKWLIEDYLDGNVDVPWLAWGPYLWAHGTTPRADGFTWLCEDTRSTEEVADNGRRKRPDFIHPSVGSGRRKIGDELFKFFATNEITAPWFLK